jgi:hypothetical protein
MNSWVMTLCSRVGGYQFCGGTFRVKASQAGTYIDYVGRMGRINRRCGLVVRVPGYRSRGPGFDSLLYQIF